MNIKIADFLFEEEAKDTEASSDTNQQDQQDSQDDEGRKKIREPLSEEEIFSGSELTIAELNKVCEAFAKLIMGTVDGAKKAKEFKESIEGKSDLSQKEKETQAKFLEIEKKPLGALDKDVLLKLFKLNYNLGYGGKIGRIHLNPLQMIKGKGQVEGATTQDLGKYQDSQHVFGMLSDQDSKPLQCNGKVVLIAIPALLSNVTENLDLYRTTYPGVSKEEPVIYNIKRVFYTLLDRNDIAEFQTNNKKLSTFVSREKQQAKNIPESFIYNKGIKSLIAEAAGDSDTTTSGASSSGSSDSEPSNDNDAGDNEKSIVEKITGNFDSVGFASALLDDCFSSIKSSVKKPENARHVKRVVKKAAKETIGNYTKDLLVFDESTPDSILAYIGGIYYKKSSSDSDDDLFAKSLAYEFFAKFLGKNVESVFDRYNNLIGGLKLDKIPEKGIPTLSSRQIKNINAVLTDMLVTVICSNDSDSIVENIEALTDSVSIFGIEDEAKKFHRYIRKDLSINTDYLVEKFHEALKGMRASKASDDSLLRFSKYIIQKFSEIKGKDGEPGAASKVLLQNLESEEIKKEDIPEYIVISLIKSSPEFFETIVGMVRQRYEAFWDKWQLSNERHWFFIHRLYSNWSNIKSSWNKADIAEMGFRLWINDSYTEDDFGELFESKLSLSNLLLEVDEEKVGKSDLGTEIDGKKFKKGVQWCKDLFRKITAGHIKKVFLKLIRDKDFAPINNDNMPKFFKGMKDKEDKEYKSNLSKFLNKKITNISSQKKYIDTKNNLAEYITGFIKHNATGGIDNKSFSGFIDTVIKDYISTSLENVEKEVAEKIKKDKALINAFTQARVPKIDLSLLTGDSAVEKFSIKVGEDKDNPILDSLKKSKVFNDDDDLYNDVINDILVAMLFMSILEKFNSTFLEVHDASDPVEVKFIKDEFITFLKSNNFLDSLLTSSIKDFEESVLITNEVEEELREKYIASMEEEAWNKFVIYAYFYEPEKKLSALLRENIMSKDMMLSRALYENDKFAEQMLLNEIFPDFGLSPGEMVALTTMTAGVAGAAKMGFDKIKSKIKSKDKAVSPVSDEARNYLSELIDNIINGTNTATPLGWKSSIESAEEAGLSEVEKENLNLNRVKHNCGLIVNSVYKTLIKEEWSEYSKNKKDEKLTSRQRRRSTRSDFYEKSSEKVKTGSVLGFGTMAVAALATGGLSVLPLAVGGLLLTDEIGSLGGGLVKTGLKLADATVSGGAAMFMDSRASRVSLQDRLDILEYDVNLKEEIDALYKTFKSIKDGEGLGERVLENLFIHNQHSFSKLLLEDDSDSTSDSTDKSSDSKKEKLKEIDESVVTQILEGNGFQLFSSDFDNQNVYNTFFVKLNGTLRKYARVTIKNIKNKPIVKQLAKDQASEVADSEAQVGQPASPIIDLLMRQMSTTGEPPVAALASALNDVNHSGGGVANLLVYMMLTNPQGFNQMVGSFEGNKGEALQKVIDLMSQASNSDPQRVASAATRGSTPAIEISNEEFTKIGDLIKAIKDSKNSSAIVSCLKVNDKKDLDDLLRRADDISVKSTNVERDDESAQKAYDLFMTILFRPQDTYTFKDLRYNFKINSNETQFFMEAFTAQYALYNIFAKNNKAINDVYSNLIDIDSIIKLGEVVCLDQFYNTIDEKIDFSKKINGDRDTLKNSAKKELEKCALYKEIKSLNLHESKALKRVNLLNEDFIGGDLSSLLFENKISKNIVKKEDKINLNKEWRKLWNI